jgi:hypothetical protein
MSELFNRLSEEEASIVAQGLKIMVRAIDSKQDEARK